MRQRGLAWLSFLPYIIGAAVVSAAAYTAWYKVDHWCNSACGEQQEKAAVAEQAIEAARERATALALLWADAIHKVEVRYVEVVKERVVRVESIRERAGKIKPATDAVAIPVPADASRLLSDSANLANDTAPASGDSSPAAPVPETTDSTLTEWITFAVDAAEAYADARQKHQACVSWAAQISGPTGQSAQEPPVAAQ
jgi:hypothetical protein